MPSLSIPSSVWTDIDKAIPILVKIYSAKKDYTGSLDTIQAAADKLASSSTDLKCDDDNLNKLAALSQALTSRISKEANILGYGLPVAAASAKWNAYLEQSGVNVFDTSSATTFANDCDQAVKQYQQLSDAVLPALSNAAAMLAIGSTAAALLGQSISSTTALTPWTAQQIAIRCKAAQESHIPYLISTIKKLRMAVKNNVHSDL